MSDAPAYARPSPARMSLVPEPVRTRRHARHNLHEVAWSPHPPDQPATLDWFMADYVAHLEHHLRQVPDPA